MPAGHACLQGWSRPLAKVGADRRPAPADGVTRWRSGLPARDFTLQDAIGSVSKSCWLITLVTLLGYEILRDQSSEHHISSWGPHGRLQELSRAELQASRRCMYFCIMASYIPTLEPRYLMSTYIYIHLYIYICVHRYLYTHL